MEDREGMNIIPINKLVPGLGISARWNPLAVIAPGGGYNLVWFDITGDDDIEHRKNWLAHWRHTDQESVVKSWCSERIHKELWVRIIDDHWNW